ncbi:hypothetical protein SAMN05421847_2694 [Halpernia humi]|uniref:DUF6438 domain-containing protein n=1 Tax=Halpernia humi TaxID=493375 RepID=A0A1H6B3Y1_9FLAO|nr:hypothetical protein [Halpernia humi]SEG55310.1 hypothetical protein SAMN05421847_2694 [Halpernia humi]
MLKYILLFFGLVLLSSCEKKTLNEKEILELIHLQTGFESMELGTDFNSSDNFIDSIKTFRKIIEKEHFKAIYKADFNNDGKEDYLINFHYQKKDKDNGIPVRILFNDIKTCALLLSNNDGYKLLNPGKRKVYDIFSSKIINYKNQNLIKLISFKRSLDDRNDILRSDTLMIKNNQLTEFVKPHQNHKIDKIIYTLIGGYVPTTTYNLTFKKDSVFFSTKFYKKFDGKYFTTNFKNFPQLSNDLNEIDFKNLSDHYAVNGNDLPTKKIEIFFDGGKIKTISDFGERGTLGLVNFYEKIDSLMAKQNWQPIISKID